ncbi:sensor histidine kinase [Streptosporangium sp. NPDC050855]|uniref:sensor histidine kinase n=1 Tax=Streptosporangium sp. NPDC050855 TaxID=3366194 RepID=UPI0037B4D669
MSVHSGVSAMTAAVVAVSAVVVVLRGRAARPVVASITTWTAAAVSLAVTVASSAAPSSRATAWDPVHVPMLVELGAFAVLIVRIVRRAPVRHAVTAGGVATAVIATMVLRLIGPPSPLAAVGACALWALGAMIPVGAGLHLRRQDRSRERFAVEMQHAQRLRLARDLHDFVAHDLSEMVAAAQAGQVVTSPGEPRSVELFHLIERAGQRAMTSMDRTVHMLSDVDASGTGYTLGDLPDLLAGFTATGPVTARLDLDPALPGSVTGPWADVAYRIVAEALTNVRRHAPTATGVTVTVRRDETPSLTVTVVNTRPEGAPAFPRGHLGGRGLAGLRAQTEAVGGRLTAGRHDGGWRLTATVPLPGAV